MSTDDNARQHQYGPGHSATEIERLIEQGRWLGDLTERVFRDAGMARGMRVLDVGAGAGDVSFLAAHIVGPEGAVIGVDQSPDAVTVASLRAREAGLTNVRFVVDDLRTFAPPEPVDFVVGRLVLMYLPDPAAVVRHLAAHVKDGGMLAFQEMDVMSATSEPRCPLFEAAVERVRQTFARGGMDYRAGLHLGRTFEQAGLGAPAMTLTGRVERGRRAMIFPQLVGITRALLPLMTAQGVATAESIDIETLESRMRDEAVGLDATIVAPPLIGAWARKMRSS